MQVTNLDITTPYDEVLAIAVEAIHQQDFSFDTDPSGCITGMTIYDDIGEATRIAMDCIMFCEVYALAFEAGGLTQHQRAIIDPIAHQLH